VIDEVVARNLLEKATPRANRINQVLLEAADLRELRDEQMTIAALVYAVNLAKLTNLNVSDFISLCAFCYMHTGHEAQDEQPEGN
jgi:hypothetical protein